MPDCCNYYDGKRYGLVVLNNCFTLICYPDPLNERNPGKELTDIWLMEEYGINKSWVKKYTFRYLPIESPLEIWRDHVLLLQTMNGFLISYNLNSDEIEEYNLQACFRVAIYKESLTPIPKGSQLCNQVQMYYKDDITL